jgi:hypothetical protein
VHVGDSERNLPLSGTFRVDRTAGPRFTRVTAPAVAVGGGTLSVTTTFTNGSTVAVHGAATSLSGPAGSTYPQDQPVSIYAASIPLSAGKQVAYVAVPDNKQLHIFADTIS